ncbi:MAG: prepilin peptidase [Leisingera sp.]
MSAYAGFVPLAAVGPLLIWAGINDLRQLRIPNWLVLCMAAVFLLTAPLLPLPETGMRLLAAGVVALICAALFHLRVIAGGDVKMMSVAILFVPSSALSAFGWCFSAAMIAVVIAVAAPRVSPPATTVNWAAVQAPGSLPMGAAISLGLAALPVAVGLAG